MFDLHITCTKDITFLKIDFADGTSVVGEKNNEKDVKINRNDDIIKNKFTETEHTFNKVKLPEIQEKKRDVKVAEELQDLEL